MDDTPLQRASIKHLPGAHLEGGGQLLRLATGFAALTSAPLAITNIRGGRSGGGGMKPQHLSAVHWLAAASGARVAGMVKKSKDLIFVPNDWALDEEAVLSEDRFLAAMMKREQLVGIEETIESHIDIGSPGAITLVFQALLPFILFSSPVVLLPSTLEQFHLTIRGGTNVTQSPSIDYLRLVLFPMLSLIGLPPIHCHITERGWITGRPEVGSVTFSVTPLPKGQMLPPFELRERGKITDIKAVILAPQWSKPHFERLIRETIDSIEETKGVQLDLEFEDSGHPKRMYLLLVASSDKGVKLGRDWLFGSDKGFRPKERGSGSKNGKERSDRGIDDVQRTVSKVVGDLSRELEHGGCVDEQMHDQLVVFQALADGKSFIHGGDGRGETWEPSLHTKTARWVAEVVAGACFDDEGHCQGIGFVAGSSESGKVRKRAVAQMTTELEGLRV